MSQGDKEDVMLKWTMIVMMFLVGVVLPSFAGIKVRSRTDSVDALEIDGGSYGRGPWSVDSPTIRSRNGYLAYEARGKSPRVYYSTGKGIGTSWSFVETFPFESREPDGTY